jgi:hypothetical protein
VNLWRYLVYLLLAAVLMLPMFVPLGLPFGEEIPNLSSPMQRLETITPRMPATGGMAGKPVMMPPPGMMGGKGQQPAAAPITATVPHPPPPDMAQDPVERLYRAIDSLPPGSLILLGVDFGASSQAEMLPLLSNITDHIFRGGRHLLVIALVDQGPLLSSVTLRNVAARYNAVYGRDWALLGTIPGEETALLRFGRDIRSVFTVDLMGNKVEYMPIMQGVDNAGQISLAIDLSEGEAMPVSYVKMLGSLGLPIGAALTASAAPNLMPYLQSRQILGLAAGLPGAAHYEMLSGRRGPGLAALDALSLGGILLILLIVVGNLTRVRSK